MSVGYFEFLSFFHLIIRILLIPFFLFRNFTLPFYLGFFMEQFIRMSELAVLDLVDDCRYDLVLLIHPQEVCEEVVIDSVPLDSQLLWVDIFGW